MSEVGEPERGSFHAFEQVVHCFGGGVRDVSVVPGCDLVFLSGEGAAEPVHFGWAVLVLEIGGEAGDELVGSRGVGVGVDAPDHLFCVPGGAELAP